MKTELEKSIFPILLSKSRITAKATIPLQLVEKSPIDFFHIAKRDLINKLAQEAIPLLNSGIKQTENNQFQTISFELEAYVFTEETFISTVRGIINAMPIERIIDIRNENNSSNI